MSRHRGCKRRDQLSRDQLSRDHLSRDLRRRMSWRRGRVLRGYRGVTWGYLSMWDVEG